MFKSGDILVVQPQDPDDCEALAHAGERCQLVRYVDVYSGSRYAIVRFTTQGRGFYFRSGDLVFAPQALEPSATVPENETPPGAQTQETQS